MSRCLQQEMSTLILRWDVCKTVLSMWVGACNRVCLYWFWDGNLQGSLLWISIQASATGYVYTDSEMGHLQDSLIYMRHLQHEMSTLIPRWDVYKTVWSVCPVWEATATRNVYIDSEMGCSQDSLGCMKGICKRKCLPRFWDGTFTRHSDLYKRHLQQEMSPLILTWDVYKTVWSVSVYERHLHQEMNTSIPRWDVYKTVWSVQEASATWTGSITEWCGVFMIRHFSRASFICTSRYLQYEMATFIPRWDLYKGVWFEQLRWAI